MRDARGPTTTSWRSVVVFYHDGQTPSCMTPALANANASLRRDATVANIMFDPMALIEVLGLGLAL